MSDQILYGDRGQVVAFVGNPSEVFLAMLHAGVVDTGDGVTINNVPPAYIPREMSNGSNITDELNAVVDQALTTRERLRQAMLKFGEATEE